MSNAKLGKTGKFPEGKITPTDEGELAFTIWRTDELVIIDFSTQVTWMAMKPEDAKDLAGLLIAHANCAVWDLDHYE